MINFKKIIKPNILRMMKGSVFQSCNHFYKFIIIAHFLQKKVQMILQILKKVYKWQLTFRKLGNLGKLIHRIVE